MGFTTLYFGGLLAYSVILTRNELRPVWRVHPAWPWRLRRRKSRALAGVEAVRDPWLDEL
jgi:hypothetical protein